MEGVTYIHFKVVATVLTACGIETLAQHTCEIFSRTVATVLTACGIETLEMAYIDEAGILSVATVLTACGIETMRPETM